MNNFTKKDLVSSTITGLYAGVIAWRVLAFLKAPTFGLPYHPHSWLVIIVPILWILGVNLGYFLGHWMSFFNQFGKFAAIGFTNFLVYLGILNIFIASTGIAIGIWYSIFVSVAFLISVVHSYAWNKYWVFSAGGDDSRGQFFRFIVITLLAGLINVGVASFVVNFTDPLFGITPEGWANIGGVAGSAVALIFSFIGIRLVVFRKQPTTNNQQLTT